MHKQKEPEKYISCREDADKIRLPMNMEDAKALATVLSNYKDDYFFTVVLAFFYIYVLYPFCMVDVQYFNILRLNNGNLFSLFGLAYTPRFYLLYREIVLLLYIGFLKQ